MTAPAPAPDLFLHGNGLPGRWAGSQRFVLLQTGFGLGRSFLAAWRAWRDDPQRCGRLVFVALEPHPPHRDDLTREHAAQQADPLAFQLIAAWPPLTANVHALDFEGGRLRLLLAFGEREKLLPKMSLRFDALILDDAEADAAPGDGWDPRFFKALARRAAPGATVASRSTSTTLRSGLRSAGFELESPSPGRSDDHTTARYVPRFQPRGTGDAADTSTADARRAVVVGAGLAGAWVAHELATLGWQVEVLDRQPGPAMETSGNPAGLFHGTVHEGDGPYARLFRAAALQAQRRLQPLIGSGAVPGQLQGLLRLDRQADALARMQRLITLQDLPPAYVPAWPADAARQAAGVPLHDAAWFYPGGGWIAPADLVQHLLQVPGIRFCGGSEVARLQRAHDAWQLLDDRGTVLAESPVVVLANAAQAASLCPWMTCEDWPISRSRGQVTLWRRAAGTAMPLRLPLAGDGYALPMLGGDLLCGSGSSEDQGDAGVQDADHLANLSRFECLSGLAGFAAGAAHASLGGRVGWRLQAADRLPIVGPVPLAAADWAPGQRRDQVRLIPRQPGLHVATAFGARGLTLAPLCGALLAAMISGEPWPLETDLAEAIDPARWQVRQARRAV